MEEKKIQNKNVLFLFLIIIILIGGFLVYNNYNNKEEQKVVVEKSPIEITNNDDGTKTVRNVEEGYEVKVSDDYYINDNSFEESLLMIQDYQEPELGYGGIPGCKVFIEKKEGNLSNIIENTKNNCLLDNECTNYDISEIIINHIKWYSISYFGEYVGSGNPEFKTEDEKFVYTLYFNCDNQNFINNIISNFIF